MSFTLDSKPHDPPQTGVWRIKGPETFAVTEPAFRATSWPPIAANENAIQQAETCLTAATGARP
jgi:hypothetical protein